MPPRYPAVDRRARHRALQRARWAFAHAIERHLTRCILHGYQPAVPACTCVLAGAPHALSSLEAVLCNECMACHYEDELEIGCFQCLLERGLLPALAPPDSIEASPMFASPPCPADFAFEIQPDPVPLPPGLAYERYCARPDAD